MNSISTNLYDMQSTEITIVITIMFLKFEFVLLIIIINNIICHSSKKQHIRLLQLERANISINVVPSKIFILQSNPNPNSHMIFFTLTLILTLALWISFLFALLLSANRSFRQTCCTNLLKGSNGAKTLPPTNYSCPFQLLLVPHFPTFLRTKPTISNAVQRRR